MTAVIDRRAEAGARPRRRARGADGRVDARFVKSFPRTPDGNCAAIVFRTSFANKAVGRETVTLEREGDHWRVVGYLIA